MKTHLIRMAAMLLVLFMGFLTACKSTGNRPSANTAKPTRTAVATAPKKAVVIASTPTAKSKSKFKLFSRPLFGRREAQPALRLAPKASPKAKPVKAIAAARPTRPAPVITQIFPAPAVEIPSPPSVQENTNRVQDAYSAASASEEVKGVGGSIFPTVPVHPEDMLPLPVSDSPARPIALESEEASTNEQAGLALLTPTQEPAPVAESLKVEVAEAVAPQEPETISPPSKAEIADVTPVMEETEAMVREAKREAELEQGSSLGPLLLPSDSVPTISIREAGEPVRASAKSAVVTAELTVDNMQVSDSPVLLSTLHVRTIGYLGERIAARIVPKGMVGSGFETQGIAKLDSGHPRAATPSKDSFDTHYVFDMKAPIRSASERYVIEIAASPKIDGMTLHIEKPGEDVPSMNYRLIGKQAVEMLTISKSAFDRARDPTEMAKNLPGRDHAADAVDYVSVEKVDPEPKTEAAAVAKVEPEGLARLENWAIENIGPKMLLLIKSIMIGLAGAASIILLMRRVHERPRHVGHSGRMALCGWDTIPYAEPVSIRPRIDKEKTVLPTRAPVKSGLHGLRRLKHALPVQGAIPRHRAAQGESEDSEATSIDRRPRRFNEKPDNPADRPEPPQPPEPRRLPRPPGLGDPSEYVVN